MSQRVEINYGHIAATCESICDRADSAIVELDRVLKDIDNNSKTIRNNSSIDFEKQIINEKDRIVNLLAKLRLEAKDVSKQENISVESNDYRNKSSKRIINLANDLNDKVNILLSNKIIEYKELLNTLLIDRINNGGISNKEEIIEFIESIEDESLSRFTYMAYLKNPNMSKEELLEVGKALMEETYKSAYEKKVDEIKADLQQHKIDKDIIKDVISSKSSNTKTDLLKIQQAASKEIIDESVRKKSLSIIKKAITKRGFIVENKNIKIDRTKNEVTLVALRASGEKATFKVYLDGKFIYDFHGYEGQACQKDITPFLNDLEEVYGMHIISSNELWSNPDKISTMKYQAMNTNKNKG